MNPNERLCVISILLVWSPNPPGVFMGFLGDPHLEAPMVAGGLCEEGGDRVCILQF